MSKTLNPKSKPNLGDGVNIKKFLQRKETVKVMRNQECLLKGN